LAFAFLINFKEFPVYRFLKEMCQFRHLELWQKYKHNIKKLEHLLILLASTYLQGVNTLWRTLNLELTGILCFCKD